MVASSAVREDFSARSDIDALVSFAPHSNWSLFDHVQMNQELQEIFRREVNLITRRALEQSCNTLLRAEILGFARYIFRNKNTPMTKHRDDLSGLMACW
jgi:predicted nucleotidyltransferase